VITHSPMEIHCCLLEGNEPKKLQLLVDKHDTLDTSLLAYAYVHNSVEIFEILLSKGKINLNAIDDEPILFTCLSRRISSCDKIRLLLHAGANPNVKHFLTVSHTILEYALWNKSIDIIELLLEYGANVGTNEFYRCFSSSYRTRDNKIYLLLLRYVRPHIIISNWAGLNYKIIDDRLHCKERKIAIILCVLVVIDMILHVDGIPTEWKREIKGFLY